jgi:hypothetical protein
MLLIATGGISHVGGSCIPILYVDTGTVWQRLLTYDPGFKLYWYTLRFLSGMH